MTLPTPHLQTIATPDGTRYFSNAPCAAQSALDAHTHMSHPRYGVVDYAECLSVAQMSATGAEYERWLEEQRER